MSRKLPILVERSIADVHADRVRVSQEFERNLREVEGDGGPALSCHKGCANCCYHPVQISILEGVLLYRWLVTHGKWSPVVRQKCEQASSATFGLAMETWLLAAIPCPLLELKTNTCTAYAGRPFSCRTIFSMSDPDECHPHTLTVGALLPRVEPSEVFMQTENAALKRHGLERVLVPISTAVLMGERIDTGKVDLEACNTALYRDYMEIS